MRILLAIDGSSFGDAAVSDVATVPWGKGSEVRIISVAEPMPPRDEIRLPQGKYLEVIEKTCEDQARSVVSQAGDRIAKKQGNRLRVLTDFVKCHSKRAIIEDAQAWGADLIVVGSNRYRALTKLG